jgi:hypothetical protein
MSPSSTRRPPSSRSWTCRSCPLFVQPRSLSLAAAVQMLFTLRVCLRCLHHRQDGHPPLVHGPAGLVHCLFDLVVEASQPPPNCGSHCVTWFDGRMDGCCCCCCQRGISNICPASPKPPPTKNKQQAKNKNCRSAQHFSPHSTETSHPTRERRKKAWWGSTDVPDDLGLDLYLARVLDLDLALGNHKGSSITREAAFKRNCMAGQKRARH